MVINLQDWGTDLEGLRGQFADWPMPGLKEVKAVTPAKKVVPIWPMEEAD